MSAVYKSSFSLNNGFDDYGSQARTSENLIFFSILFSFHLEELDQFCNEINAIFREDFIMNEDVDKVCNPTSVRTPQNDVRKCQPSCIQLIENFDSAPPSANDGHESYYLHFIIETEDVCSLPGDICTIPVLRNGSQRQSVKAILVGRALNVEKAETFSLCCGLGNSQ